MRKDKRGEDGRLLDVDARIAEEIFGIEVRPYDEFFDVESGLRAIVDSPSARAILFGELLPEDEARRLGVPADVGRIAFGNSGQINPPESSHQ